MLLDRNLPGKWYPNLTWHHWGVVYMHNFRELSCFPLWWKCFIYLFFYAQNAIKSQRNLPPIGRSSFVIPHFLFRFLTGVSTPTFHSNDTEYSFGWIGCDPVSKTHQEEPEKRKRIGSWEGPWRAFSLGLANFRIAVTSLPTCFRHC